MERITTGVADLDLVLGGGLPEGSLIFVAGGSGTGKTILAQQICFANATGEHKALFYSTFSSRTSSSCATSSSSTSSTRARSRSGSSSSTWRRCYSTIRASGETASTRS